jgi:SPX domain protein involved in polyphosphate accumulation
LKKELQNIEEHCRHPHSTSSKIYPTNDIEANGAVSNSDDKTNVINLDHVKSSKSIIKNLNQRTNRTFHRKLNDLKLAFSEFYLMLVLLKNYQTLNFTGFRKILKKHDKLFETTRGDKWR